MHDVTEREREREQENFFKYICIMENQLFESKVSFNLLQQTYFSKGKIHLCQRITCEDLPEVGVETSQAWLGLVLA